MIYREPVPGDTIHCWADGEKSNYLRPGQMLYLGKDKNADDNLLVQSRKYGWNIIPLSDLPKGKHRPLGICNLEEVVKEEGLTIGYTYRFRDSGQVVLITVRLIDGVWKVKKNFKNPSWVYGEAVKAKKEGV